MADRETFQNESSGMPHDTDELVIVGRIARAHGLKGEVRVFPAVGCAELFSRIKRFFVETSTGLLELVPCRIRAANRYLIVAFDGYQGRDQADRLRDKVLWVPPAELPELEEGDVYQFTQLGAVVYDEHGRQLGKVEEILDSPAHPVFRIAGAEGEFLFPAAEPWIISHGLREGVPVLVVRLPEGLIESQDPRSTKEP